MASLHEYFVKDFSAYMSTLQEHALIDKASGVKTPLEARMHYDFNGCSKFSSIYVPAGAPVRDVVAHYANDHSLFQGVGKDLEVQTGVVGLPIETTSKDLVFTGRLFVYAEQLVDEATRVLLVGHCGGKGLKLVVRDWAYRDGRNKFERPMAFISHDSRDKVKVAEPIAVGLQKLICPVWYDQFSLKVGDSLRESIESGIKESNTCVVILSKAFFSNRGWTKAEFDSIYTKEIIEKKRVMLPVWVDVKKEDVYDYSPRLADRVGVPFELGIDEVVRRLYNAIQGASG